MLRSIMKDNMFPLALMGVLDFRGLCTIDPSPSPPSTLEEMFKYGGLRNSCSIFALVQYCLDQEKISIIFTRGVYLCFSLFVFLLLTNKRRCFIIEFKGKKLKTYPICVSISLNWDPSWVLTFWVRWQFRNKVFHRFSAI